MLQNGLKYCDECNQQIFLVERQVAVLDMKDGAPVHLHFHHYQGRACYTAFFIRRGKEATREVPCPEYEAT